MSNPKRYCLALDLNDDEKLIAEYIEHHKPANAWPQITTNMRELGILDMEIYHLGDRLFMIMETTQDFDPNEPPKTQQGREASDEWEELMWKYQKPVKWAKEGQKWVPMNKIYDLKEARN